MKTPKLKFTVILVGFLMFSISCQEKHSQSPVTTRATSPTPQPAGPGTTTPIVPSGTVTTVISNTDTSDTLCKDLKAQSELNQDVSAQVEYLCGNSAANLAILRGDAYLFKGGNTPKILAISAELANKKTQMEVYTANVYDSDAETYFKLLKLQQIKPKDFKAAVDSNLYGFSFDAAIDYRVMDTSASVTNFSYVNDQDKTVTISYKGASKFYELKSSKAGINRYASSTKLTNPDSSETLKSMSTLIVVNEYEAKDTNAKLRKYAEVFTLSSQIYDNSGDHPTTVSKTKKNVGAEQVRGSQNAANAARYFSATGG